MPLEKAIENFLMKLKSGLDSKSGKPLALGAKEAIQFHFQGKPTYYNPRKVNEGNSSGNVGVTYVDIPGISRAYHDIDIFPRHRNNLTIPLHREAFGKKATDFNNLFKVKMKNGKEFLARNNGGSITMMYVLSKHVHQRQDPGIMPSDNSIAKFQFNRLKRLVNDIATSSVNDI